MGQYWARDLQVTQYTRCQTAISEAELHSGAYIFPLIGDTDNLFDYMVNIARPIFDKFELNTNATTVEQYSQLRNLIC